jgi:hypothetical protein
MGRRRWNWPAAIPRPRRPEVFLNLRCHMARMSDDRRAATYVHKIFQARRQLTSRVSAELRAVDDVETPAANRDYKFPRGPRNVRTWVQ